MGKARTEDMTELAEIKRPFFGQTDELRATSSDAASTSSSNEAASQGTRGRRVWKPAHTRYLEAAAAYFSLPLAFSRAVRSELSTVFRLTIELYRQIAYLPGKKWIVMLIRLLIYAFILLPGFIQVGVFYLCSSRVRKSVPYGTKPRNRLDIFLPRPRVNLERGDPGLPVVIFVTGGAWIIGYKAWGSLLGKVLSKEGVVVVSLDYRNFPQGKVLDMLQDVQCGIEWVVDNIAGYGGNPEDICLVGQSAGAHLCSLALVDCAERRNRGRPELSWAPRQIKTFVGVSGAYNIRTLVPHLNSRGLHKQLLEAIMLSDGRTSLEDISPACLVQRYAELESDERRRIVSSLPPFVLLHGRDDDSIPYSHAVEFNQVLEAAGVPCTLCVFDGETHTTPLVENPMRGNKDRLSEAIMDIVRPAADEEASCKNRPLVPKVLCKVATAVCPF